MVTLRQRVPKTPPPPPSLPIVSGTARTQARQQAQLLQQKQQQALDRQNALRKEKLARQAAKKAAQQAAKNARKPANRRNNQTNPLALTCPQTSQPVWPVTATLTDIKTARQKSRPPYRSDRAYLVTVASPATRQAVYNVTADALAQLETNMLPPYGSRPWTVVVKVSDPTNNSINNANNASAKKATTKSPYFVFSPSGRLKLASFAHFLEKIPQPPKFPGFSSGTNANSRRRSQQSGGTDLEEDESHESTTVEVAADMNEHDQAVAALLEEEHDVDGLCALALEERWRVPLPTISLRWISPLRESFSTRKSAWERAVQLCRDETLLDKVLEGYGANGKPIKLVVPTKRMALQAGKLRFVRDGLWVVGQEEAWQWQRRLESETLTPTTILSNGGNDRKQMTVSGTDGSSTKTTQGRAPTALVYFLQSRRKMHQQARLAELRAGQETNLSAERDTTMKVVGGAPPSEKAKISFTLREAESELRGVWKAMSEEEQQTWENKAQAYGKDHLDGKPQDTKVLTSTAETTAAAPAPDDDICTSENFFTKDAGKYLDRHCIDDQIVSPVSPSPISHEKSRTTSSSSSLATEEDSLVDTESVAIKLQQAAPLSTTSRLDVTQSIAATDLVAKRSSKVKKINSNDDPQTVDASKMVFVGPSATWRLCPEQVKRCYDAGLEHYDRIFETVRARDLWRELQDGFDLLRERGRGRFDMELPVFETPEFEFLTSIKKAPWMSIVREILGKDVVLIHKGIFLSLPGSARQDYHQDGVHLTTQYQKPCHAINVFVPLVDLTPKLGPTEFCLGSHILDNEAWDRDFCETPLVAAGTPVIFDYRLGHNGLANTSDTSRPILYCTYAAAADGKEFKDSVNFSRKRYHKIGDLVDKVPSRQERARKRVRAVEEQQLTEAIQESTLSMPENRTSINTEPAQTSKYLRSESSA
jgi:hypothetical protein